MSDPECEENVMGLVNAWVMAVGLIEPNEKEMVDALVKIISFTCSISDDPYLICKFLIEVGKKEMVPRFANK